MGQVDSIFIASKGGEPLFEVPECRAIAGQGLEGDRYFEKSGTFSNIEGFREITLIESEAIDGLAKEYAIEIEYAQARRNIITRDVALNHLVDKEFTVGDVRLRGRKLCEPCMHMEGLTGKEGTRKGLIHRGGLRADILEGGVIRKGDRVSY
ncbi:MAG: MOSC domain-containing protein [Actinomycetota bacterium]